MSEIAQSLVDHGRNEFSRTIRAYGQAALFGFEWARDSMGHERIEAFLGSKNFMESFRKVGVVAVGSFLRNVAPNFSAEAIMKESVLDELRPNLYSVGTEAIVFREGDEVVKVLTGKTRDPEKLAPLIAERQSIFRGVLGEHAVETEVDIRTMQVFRNSPPLRYVCATQPFLQITEQYALEDDDYLRQSYARVIEAKSVTSRLKQLHDDHKLLYDTAKPGNVVAVESNSHADRFMLPDVAIASMKSPYDFVGINSFPFWHAKIYLNALNSHAERVRQHKT